MYASADLIWNALSEGSPRANSMLPVKSSSTLRKISCVRICAVESPTACASTRFMSAERLMPSAYALRSISLMTSSSSTSE